MVNNKFFLIIILTVIASHIQAQKASTAQKKSRIDPLTVEYVEVAQIKSKSKTSKPKRISKSQWSNFVSAWNNTKTIIPCEEKYSIMVWVYYTDLTRKIFTINKSVISDGSLCIKTADQGLADKLLKSK